MAWTNYSQPIEILSATDINNIKENIEIIRSLLVEKGVLVGDTKDFQASESTQFIEMFDILSNIEYNLDIISDNACKSVYYGYSVTIGDYASNKKDIWRWIKILNDMYNILNGNVGKWQYLVCNDGVVTVWSRKILVRGDLVG